MVSVQARSAQVKYALSRGISQRRACTLLSVCRSSLYYLHKLPIKDAPAVLQRQLITDFEKCMAYNKRHYTELRQPLLTFMAATTFRSHSSPAHKLLARDGDHALMLKVAEFLVPTVALPRKPRHWLLNLLC